MQQKQAIGIIGCGDFLRWMAPGIKHSQYVAPKWLFDPVQERAAKYAADVGGAVAASAEAIFADPEVSIVCLFVPPWLRAGLWEQAAAAGKHILATKPVVSTIEECDRILAASQKVRAGVLYGRSGDGMTEAARRVFASGEIGRLALYRQDNLHHYPQWNNWALDPAKNGGPFMDAMIHNLNTARYLMGRPMTAATLFSEKLAHPDLTCADTECVKADFSGGGTAHLFITWAADLAVHSTERNDREHLDYQYMVTDQGWYVTRERTEQGMQLAARRMGATKAWAPERISGSVFDRFAAAVASDAALPGDIVSPEMATADIRLLRTLAARVGERVSVAGMVG